VIEQWPQVCRRDTLGIKGMQAKVVESRFEVYGIRGSNPCGRAVTSLPPHSQSAMTGFRAREIEFSEQSRKEFHGLPELLQV
jgi:hypothetical protein